MKLPITAYTCANAAGIGRDAMADALLSHRSGLRPYQEAAGGMEAYVGRVDAIDDTLLPEPLSAFDCRNNRLAELVLGLDGFEASVAEVMARYGAGRVGLVIGTSTSGIGRSEEAFRARDADEPLPPDFDFRRTHELDSLRAFLQARLGLAGPAYTISTACASSTKAFVDGAQLIEAGLCDAVVVGGVDTLCDTSLRGFQSLQLLSAEPCRPNSAGRKGISIGEAGALAILEKPTTQARPRGWLLGYGESADAFHMSSPHPQGLGGRLAMEAALRRAGLSGSDFGYVNMHGTGSDANDRVEDAAIAAVLGTTVPCSSTKGWTGHTLGAAGSTEAVISLVSLEEGLLPGHLSLDRPDPSFTTRLQIRTERRQVRNILSNNFGFGGNNCCLVFGQGGAL